MRSISIEIKIIIGAIFFALLLVGLERYQFSENIVQQILESKKSKNKLLIDTISPIIGLYISLGLENSNTEYLNQIVKHNSDVLKFEFMDFKGNQLYRYVKYPSKELQKEADDIYYSRQFIKDPITDEKVGIIYLYFDDHEYQSILQKNRIITIKMIGMTFIVLMIFILFIKKEFKFLKKTE